MQIWVPLENLTILRPRFEGNSTGIENCAHGFAMLRARDVTIMCCAVDGVKPFTDKCLYETDIFSAGGSTHLREERKCWGRGSPHSDWRAEAAASPGKPVFRAAVPAAPRCGCRFRAASGDIPVEMSLRDGDSATWRVSPAACNAKTRWVVSRRVHRGRLQPAGGCAEGSPLSAGRTLSLRLWYCTCEQPGSQHLGLEWLHRATGGTRAGEHHVTDLPRGDAAAWLVVTQDDAGGVAPPSRRLHHPEEPCSLA